MVKRAFDLVGSVLGLLILSPLFLGIALAIKVDSAGPILYRAKRAGREGKEFRLFKFRTMIADADQRGPGITVSGDLRVTRLGRLLRHTKLDELPQLINILKGEMSLVGPRPEDPRYVALYTPEQRQVLSVRPGITSPASLHFRSEEALLIGPDWEARYTQQIMPRKLAIDLEYVRNQKFWQDMVILLRTTAVLWR